MKRSNRKLVPINWKDLPKGSYTNFEATVRPVKSGYSTKAVAQKAEHTKKETIEIDDDLVMEVARIILPTSAHDRIYTAHKLLQSIAKRHPGLLGSKRILVEAIRDLQVRHQLSAEGVWKYIQENQEGTSLAKDKKKGSKKKKKPFIQIIYTPMGGDS
jgi:hypothetical protein